MIRSGIEPQKHGIGLDMLNHAKLRAAQPRAKAYKLTDAHQLYLFVTPKTSFFCALKARCGAASRACPNYASKRGDPFSGRAQSKGERDVDQPGSDALRIIILRSEIHFDSRLGDPVPIQMGRTD